MKKYLFSISGLLFGFFIAGCATSFKYTIRDTPVYPEAEPDKALIYVVRPSFLGFVTPFEVYNDGNPVGVTKGQTYFYFFADPGEHLITSKAENTAELRAIVQAGQTYYIKQSVGIGYLYVRNSLLVMDQKEGIRELGNCRYIETELQGKLP